MALFFMSQLSCRGGEEGREAPADRANNEPIKFFTEGELDRLRQSRRADLADRAKRRCARPGLRPPFVEGDRAAAMLAIMAGTQEVDANACYRAISAHRPAIHAAIYGETKDDQARGALRSNRRALEITLDRMDKASRRELKAKCDPVLDLLQKTVQREGGCSPFYPGTGALPELVRVALLREYATLQARRMFAQGRLRAGLRLLLDLWRFGQDLNRAGAGPSLAKAHAQSIWLLAAPFEVILNREAKIPVDFLDQLQSEAGRLLETGPETLLLLQTAALEHDLYEAMPNLSPRLKAPSGGWGASERSEEHASAAASQFKGERWGVVQGAGLSLLYSSMRKRVEHSACAKKSLSDCVTGLTLEGTRTKDDSHATLASARPDSPEFEAARRDLATTLGSARLGESVELLRGQAISRFYLSALRLHAAMRAYRSRTGRCLFMSDLSSEAFAPMTVDPNTEAGLKITKVTDEALRVQSTFFSADAGGAVPTWEIRCKIKKERPAPMQPDKMGKEFIP